MKTKLFNEFIKQFSDSLPPPLRDMSSEFEKQLKRAFEVAFQKLNLITREEFDIQTEVLAKTRGKLEKLEKRLSQLENQQ